ncbi:MAG: FAD-binding oxidoreductase [Gammaproteobacteria bacterium]|nr:FAD-binding oxidoreductase [Gammaproteobacteria bacterium]
MPKSYDVIVIGAGIIGCATSLALGRKGWKVLNLDRLPAAGYGSTSGSCAIVRPLPDGYNSATACVMSDNDIGVYKRPEQDDNLLIGSEDPPVDQHEWVDPDDYNHDFTEQWRVQVLRVCQRVLFASARGQPG